MNVYTTAWDKGLKTTYYLHMKPRHSAEQSTTTVNKAQALGKRGFAVLRDKVSSTQAEKEEVTVAPPSPIQIKDPVTIPKTENINIHVSEDPQEKFLCESCQ